MLSSNAPYPYQLVTVETEEISDGGPLGIWPISFLLVLPKSAPGMQKSPQGRNTDMTKLSIFKLGCMALHESIPSIEKMTQTKCSLPQYPEVRKFFKELWLSPIVAFSLLPDGPLI